MIAVRLEDGTTVYAFGAMSVIARKASGDPDDFWQRGAEASLAQHGGALYDGLMGLPGARLIHDGPVGPVAGPLGPIAGHLRLTTSAVRTTQP